MTEKEFAIQIESSSRPSRDGGPLDDVSSLRLAKVGADEGVEQRRFAHVGAAQDVDISAIPPRALNLGDELLYAKPGGGADESDVFDICSGKAALFQFVDEAPLDSFQVASVVLWNQVDFIPDDYYWSLAADYVQETGPNAARKVEQVDHENHQRHFIADDGND